MSKTRSIINIHVIKYSDRIKNALLKELTKGFKIYGNTILVKFRRAQDYWKYPENKECFFGIHSKEKISIKDLIKLINVTWHYTSGPSHDVDDPKKRTFIHEDAIWSKNTEPDETFLNKNVVWAHIYTWDPF